MGRLFAVLVLIVAGVIGLGFYRGWFELSSSSGDGKSRIEVNVDQKKIQVDENKAENAVRGKK